MTFPSHLEDKYELLTKLAEGGMGDVYTARHRLLDEVRVIKVMRRGLRGKPELADRFLREARVASRLRHANIAQMFDFTAEPGEDAAIVMEHIDGSTLEDIRALEPPPIALTLEIARQTLEALDYLHSKRFVHRDISPDNIMLALEAGRPRVRLIDMGIAKALEASVPDVTVAGGFVGKVRYCSPEQLAARTEIDGRSDLYSFGVVLYELLTGLCPIRGETAPTLIAGHLFRPPMAFEESDPQGRVPPKVRWLVLTALAKEPRQRMADARTFGEELVEVQRSLPLADGVAEAVVDRVRESAEATGRARPARPLLALPESVSGRERILAGLARGLRLAEIGRYREALECAASVRCEDPDVERLARRVDQEIGRYERLQRQMVAVTSTLVSVEDMLAEGRLDDAEAVLREGERRSEAGPFSGLRDRVGQHQTDVTRPSRRRAAGLAKAATLAAAAFALVVFAVIFVRSQRQTAEAPVDVPRRSVSNPVVSPPRGVLVVDAVPWAEVVELRSATGESLELPSDASTPLRLDLPAGGYQLLLRDDRGAEPRTLSVEVPATGALHHTVTMRDLSIDAFFEAQGF